MRIYPGSRRRRHSYKYRSESTVNDMTTTETKSIRSHLSIPHVLKAAKGLRGIEDGRPSITVVPTRALVGYQCDWFNN